MGRGAIYEPSDRAQTALIAEMARVEPGDLAADLGSGDGRVVIALARAGAQAHGYEVNLYLVLLSRLNIRRAGLAGRAFIHWKSFWRASFEDFQVVTTFQVGVIMARLEAKLAGELAPGARIVSHHWRFPTLPIVEYRQDVYLYRPR